jgi:tetratricopeptide (TPR) repeat protein
LITNRNGFILSLILMLVQACATPDATKRDGSAAEGKKSDYVAQSDLSSQQRFREVMKLLEFGDASAARVELVIYLESYPNSDIAKDLLAQIDLPSSEYFPSDFEEVDLASGQSLSTLSKQYLGSLYRFHALAKYNNIAEPRSTKVGQRIRIPLTDEARVAFASERAKAGVPGDENTPTLPVPQSQTEQANIKPATSEEQLADKADDLYRRAVDAFRAQDLDEAIALWDKVLEIDPNYENAMLQRSQAIELKEKLSNIN